MSLSDQFSALEKRIKTDFLNGPEREAFLKKTEALRERYGAIPDLQEESAVARGLAERFERLLSQPPIKAAGVEGLIRHAKAAWYDLSGNLGAYRWYVRCFFAAAISFFVLAPQFFPVILAIIFVVPVFLGLRGLKGRTISGFNLSAMVYPVSLMASVMGLKTYVGALAGDLAGFAAGQAAAYGISAGAAAALTAVFALASAVGAVASVAGAIVGFRHKEMFV